MNVIDFIMRFESGEVSATELIDGFAELIRSEKVWSLQGFYGRTANDLIDFGYIDEDGNVLSYPED